MITAKFVKDIKGMRSDARLYKLSIPVAYGWGDDEPMPTTEYIVVSATIADYTGPETYIFPSNEDGDIIDWGEMDGSYRGELSHAKAIINAGWISI